MYKIYLYCFSLVEKNESTLYVKLLQDVALEMSTSTGMTTTATPAGTTAAIVAFTFSSVDTSTDIVVVFSK